jgi:hypothetical protein
MEMDVELSPDLYEESAVPYLRVATVANSKFYSSKSFEATPAAAFTILSASDPQAETLTWAKIKQRKPENVILSWCDVDSLGLIIF